MNDWREVYRTAFDLMECSADNRDRYNDRSWNLLRANLRRDSRNPFETTRFSAYNVEEVRKFMGKSVLKC
jgi:hypothetical protein